MTQLQDSNESDAVAAAKKIIEQCPDVWDMTLPWPRIYWSIDVLRRYHASGYTFANLTVQDLPATFEGVQKELGDFKALCAEHADWLCFASDAAEIDAGNAAGKLTLGINVQDTELVHDDFSRLHKLREIGVRHMLLAYQVRNRAADGCAEPADAGLSLFGRELVREMNRAKMIVDVSHTGRQSSLDAIECSETPVIFSHSGVKARCMHIRNIDDVQIRECANSGGVIGVVGIGAFLGDPEAKAETVFSHIDHIVQLVGPDHAGIGTDFIDDMTPTWEGVKQAKDGAWRDPFGTQLYEGVAFAPEQLASLVAIMVEHGYSQQSIYGVLGGNFRRVYEQVHGEGVTASQKRAVT